MVMGRDLDGLGGGSDVVEDGDELVEGGGEGGVEERVQSSWGDMLDEMKGAVWMGFRLENKIVKV